MQNGDRLVGEILSVYKRFFVSADNVKRRFYLLFRCHLVRLADWH